MTVAIPALLTVLSSDRLRDLDAPKASSSYAVPRQAKRITAAAPIPLPGRAQPPGQTPKPAAPKATAGNAKLREVILAEVLDTRPSVRWDDIAGLASAKQVRQLCVGVPSSSKLAVTSALVPSRHRRGERIMQWLHATCTIKHWGTKHILWETATPQRTLLLSESQQQVDMMDG